MNSGVNFVLKDTFQAFTSHCHIAAVKLCYYSQIYFQAKGLITDNYSNINYKSTTYNAVQTHL